MDGYRTQSRDTSIEAERFQIESLRSMTLPERGDRLRALCAAVERAAELGVRQRHPRATEAEVRLRLAALRYGAEVMKRWFDWDPRVRGW